MQELLKATPDIIKAAAQSELGIIALMVIAASVIAIWFFRKAGVKVQVVVILVLLAGFVAFGAAYVFEAKEAIKLNDAQQNKASPTSSPSLTTISRPSSTEPQNTPHVAASTSAIPPMVVEPAAALPDPQQTTLPEASPAKQQSRFARGLTADQRKGLQATLSNIYILTCTYHLDRDTINSHDVAQAMDERAHDAFNQILHSKTFEPLTSDIDGLSKYKALEGALAVYELQLSIVLERSNSPGDSPAEWLNESIGFAKDQRIKLKNALDAICDYSDIPKFDNP